MADEGRSGIYILLTVTLILIIGTILYFGGVFDRSERHEIDINVQAPNSSNR